jgi:hypothetical protein
MVFTTSLAPMLCSRRAISAPIPRAPTVMKRLGSSQMPLRNGQIMTALLDVFGGILLGLILCGVCNLQSCLERWDQERHFEDLADGCCDTRR